jgi:hypothetical protein
MGVGAMVIGCSLIPMAQATMRVCNNDERDSPARQSGGTQVEKPPGRLSGRAHS